MSFNSGDRSSRAREPATIAVAPGAIDIVGAHLLRQFEKPLSLKLRVGALPLYPANRMSY